MDKNNTTPTTFWLVRHGQTDWNAEGRYQGQADVPLNATGIAQAEALAQRLKNEHFDGLYSSDLIRARQTARILGETLHLDPIPDRRLREINQGEWEGQLLEDIKDHFAAVMSTWANNPISARPPGGESLAEVANRVVTAVGDIAAAHPGGVVLIVSHGMAIATLLTRVRQIPLMQASKNIPDNTFPEIITWPLPDPVVS